MTAASPAAPADPAIRVTDLSRHFGPLAAVDRVGFSIECNSIVGLLGRNGAGKTTVMQLLSGQDFATSGEIRVFGHTPVENARVLRHVSFIKESQRYPEDFKPKHVFRSAPWFFERWDPEYAERLVDAFRLPLNTKIKKLSRGQLSAVGVIVGLASRAPITFFDEPYLGLDAVARQLFYRELLEDYAEHPRTVVLSTHLIDEVSDLLEHVLVIDQGRIIIDDAAEHLRGSATTLVGAAGAVDEFIGQRPVIHRERIGGLASVTISALDRDERLAAATAGLELSPVSLQQLVVHATTAASAAVPEGSPR